MPSQTELGQVKKSTVISTGEMTREYFDCWNTVVKTANGRFGSLSIALDNTRRPTRASFVCIKMEAPDKDTLAWADQTAADILRKPPDQRGKESGHMIVSELERRARDMDRIPSQI